MASEPLENRCLLACGTTIGLHVTPESPNTGEAISACVTEFGSLSDPTEVQFYLDDGDQQFTTEDQLLGVDTVEEDGWSLTFPTSKPVRILPLGDSITQPQDGMLSYRYPLWKMLVDAGYHFDYVGSETTNRFGLVTDWQNYQGQEFDRDHEGHFGKRADEVADLLPNRLLQYTPDIVLLHIGTNDVLWEQSINSTLKDWKRVIDTLRVDNPNVLILASLLIPGDAPWNSGIIAFNAALATTVTRWSTPESPIKLVDNYSGFDPKTMTVDTLHPNSAGEEQMAKRWFAALEEALPERTFPAFAEGSHTLFAIAQNEEATSEPMSAEFTLNPYMPKRPSLIDLARAAARRALGLDDARRLARGE